MKDGPCLLLCRGVFWPPTLTDVMGAPNRPLLPLFAVKVEGEGVGLLFEKGVGGWQRMRMQSVGIIFL